MKKSICFLIYTKGKIWTVFSSENTNFSMHLEVIQAFQEKLIKLSK